MAHYLFPPKTGEMTGTLRKLGEIHKTWKERFCVINGTNLYYYKTTESKFPQGMISLLQVNVRLSEDLYPKSPAFEIVTAKRVYKLIASSYDEMKNWMSKIQSLSLQRNENYKIEEADALIQAIEYELSNRIENNSKNE